MPSLRLYRHAAVLLNVGLIHAAPSRKVLKSSAKADQLMALEMLVRLTEPHGGKAPGELAQAVLDGPAQIDVVFLQSDGNGRLLPGDAAAFNASTQWAYASPSTIE
jgi:hypothetical protein